MKAVRIFSLLLFLLPLAGGAQEILNLYPGSIPNSKVTTAREEGSLPPSGMYTRVTTPTLEVYLPPKEKSSGAAVIICPGGGYKVIVYQGEGIATAKEFARNGVAAFVLKYRLPDDATMVDKAIGPLQDVQQAIKLVRENAARWGVQADKIGIMGFSAGGHLAATAATRFEKALVDNSRNTPLRPDFQILVYPVISMQDSLTHADSRRNLLGRQPSRETVDLFSNELQVTARTPPAYLTHAADDKLVDVDNAIAYFEKLRHQGVDVEMHVYPKGGHGFVFRHPGWMEPLFLWMKQNKWLNN
ncbi:alpha/beta hydrolase [Paraflavisolibacter sp. H34]|uniref:alpha/beta hydrolase n=1 Tax=Huijunlia imazamoxiresistens TaxID=3127457 RepID=UPI003017C504